ncbi:MAG TPA: alpha/beta hydrolase [Verrucomicrobiae bacterium]
MDEKTPLLAALLLAMKENPSAQRKPERRECVVSDGTRISYSVEGRATLEPLILQHGMTDCLESWYDIGSHLGYKSYVDVLSSSYFLILPDARGHGRTRSTQNNADYTFAAMARDVVEVFKNVQRAFGFKWKKFHFMGFSMGATIGYSVAKDYSEFVRSMVLVGEPPNVWVDKNEADRRSRVEVHEMLGQTVSDPTNEPIVRMWEEQAGVLSLPAPFAARLRDKSLTHPGSLLHLVERPWPDLTAVLPKMSCPCLLYAGELDDAIDSIRESAKQMPNATYTEKPGLNHLCSFIRSDLLLREALAFLSSLQPMAIRDAGRCTCCL